MRLVSDVATGRAHTFSQVKAWAINSDRSGRSGARPKHRDGPGEWQSVSESLSAGVYVGFLFPCYSTPIFTGMVTFASFVSRPCDAERRKGRQRAVERILASR